MSKSASVLQHGPQGWTSVEHPIGRTGFDYDAIKAMAGGFYQALRLDDRFSIICDEEGCSKHLPVHVGLQLADGTLFPIFGQFAVVRVGWTKAQGGMRTFIGLRPGDAEAIQREFPWREQVQ